MQDLNLQPLDCKSIAFPFDPNTPQNMFNFFFGQSIAESLQEKRPAEQTATKDSDNESVDSATSKEVANINETASSIQDGQSEASAAINGKLFTGAGEYKWLL